MSINRILDFRRQITDLKADYERNCLPEIERVTAQIKGVSSADLSGQGRAYVLEAQVRQYLLDPILNFLGWNLENPASLLVEDAVDSNVEGEHRRFMDYHGREKNKVGIDRSLLIVEAKRPNVILPGPATMSSKEIAMEIVKAIIAISTDDTEYRTFTTDWISRLTALIEYATRTKALCEEAPVRVAITNGEWFIVFLNPEISLVRKSPSSEEILVFKNLDEVIDRANDFYECLGYSYLSSEIPDQHPSDLHKFVSRGETIGVALGVELCFNLIRNIQPTMAARVYANVRTSKGIWVKFFKNYQPPYELMPGKKAEFLEKIALLQQYADELIVELKIHASVNLLTPVETERIFFEDGIASEWHSTTLNFSPTAELHYLTVGNTGFYVVPDESYDGCDFHAYGPCATAGNPAPPHAIMGQNRSPPVYFASGSELHCAHKTVHAARESLCVIKSFESHMCCQRCSFRERCWPDGTDHLPCSKNIQRQ